MQSVFAFLQRHKHEHAMVLLHALIVAMLLFAVTACGHAQIVKMQPPDGVKFEVVSVRFMDQQESARRSPGDVFGLDVVVRLRLSCTSKGVYVLTPRNPVHLVPEGHAVKLTEMGVVWRFGTQSGGESMQSPGSERLCGSIPCEWVRLPSYSALEWEQLDSSSPATEARAFTVFIKLSEKDAPREILSTSFDAPLQKPAATRRMP